MSDPKAKYYREVADRARKLKSEKMLQEWAERNLAEHPLDPRALRRSLQEHGRRHVAQLKREEDLLKELRTKKSTIHNLSDDIRRLEARNLELWDSNCDLAQRDPDPDTAALEKYNENVERELEIRNGELLAKNNRSSAIALAGVGAMGLGLFTMVMAPFVSLAWGFIGVSAVGVILSAVCVPMQDMDMHRTPFVLSLLVSMFLLFGLAGGL